MEKKTRIDGFGALVLVVFSALLGLNQVLVKLVNSAMHPVFQAGLRSACAFVVVLGFAILMKRRLSVVDGSLWPGVLAGVLFALEFTLVFIGLDYTSVARASVLFYTMPVWVALGAHFLIPGDSLTPLRIAGLMLACVGVIVALSQNDNPVSDKSLVGDLFCLVASTLWASIALLARTTRLSKASPEMQLLYQLAVSAPLLIIGAVWLGETWREPTAFTLGIFAFQVVVVVSIGFLTWFWVLSVYPASDMAVFSFLAPVFGVLFGWLILNEGLDWNVLVALVLVSIGIVLVNASSLISSKTVDS